MGLWTIRCCAIALRFWIPFRFNHIARFIHTHVTRSPPIGRAKLSEVFMNAGLEKLHAWVLIKCHFLIKKNTKHQTATYVKLQHALSMLYCLLKSSILLHTALSSLQRISIMYQVYCFLRMVEVWGSISALPRMKGHMKRCFV